MCTTRRGRNSMDEYRSRRSDCSQEPQPSPNSEQGIQFAPSLEKQLLQSISAHAPLPEILNQICSALNCQIGNVVSLISLTGDDASKRTGIARSAKSEEHTSELQSPVHLVCRLLLEKKKKKK